MVIIIFNQYLFHHIATGTDGFKAASVCSSVLELTFQFALGNGSTLSGEQAVRTIAEFDLETSARV